MSSIIDNNGANTLLHSLQLMSGGGREWRIATAFFSLDALMMLADAATEFERIRILFGDDASPEQRRRLLQMMRDRSDVDLLAQRESFPGLSPLKKVEQLFVDGKIEARCYTAKKFHAKAYLIDRPAVFPQHLGVIGSGNFTRPGLTQNIELNVQLTPEQTTQLAEWYEERWNEAAADVVTEDVLNEIRRQIDLYDPYAIYLKALYTWGAQQTGSAAAVRTKLIDALDPHQEQGYERAVKILERENGVMVCDGVGLGKSFVALAIMEHFCRDGKRVLLIAPKSIMTSAWHGYLANYLGEYRQPFGSLYEMAMTDLGYDTDDPDEESTEATLRKRRLAEKLYERADVVVIDESHNFRTSSAARYKNLTQIVNPYRDSRKKIILLTATPINTAYRDIANQLALITQNNGGLAGYRIDQIKRHANLLDKDMPIAESGGQLTFETLFETPSEALNNVLESVVIQRSRATCKALAQAVGKTVRFPIRKGPYCVDVKLDGDDQAYKDLIKLADQRFRPGVEFLKLMRAELEKADKKGTNVVPVTLRKGPPKGIELGAFLTEQYRIGTVEGKKVYQDEVHLAGLVFANTLKQLESSPAAFQGILQSLGLGLLARLRLVFKEQVDGTVAEHEAWVRTPLFSHVYRESPVAPEPDALDDGDALDVAGSETDEWLDQAIKGRGLTKKLHDFTAGAFDVDRWREDIEADLKFLHEIHIATIAARKRPDPKLGFVDPEVRKLVTAGKRVLLFTQSQRTAEYLEREFKTRFPECGIARIDSRVESTRATILHAFCPGYNPAPMPSAPSIPERVDILISTDVLSEGVNLQQAGAIISYDIHWNPVRLIQRIGRVDRRLNPEITPDDHSFEIVNVLPPDEINDIINLVGAVESRTLRISKTLGLDASFFKSDDPAGNLREFNAKYDGDITKTDDALNRYAKLTVDPPDEKTQRILDALPPGAFSVWDDAPVDGLFVLFVMEPKPSASPADVERFAAIIGRPVLMLDNEGGRPVSDPGEILEILAQTVKGEQSGNPSAEADLAQRLRKLKDTVRQRFAEISLPSSIAPRLVCWMELRKA